MTKKKSFLLNMKRLKRGECDRVGLVDAGYGARPIVGAAVWEVRLSLVGRVRWCPLLVDLLLVHLN